MCRLLRHVNVAKPSSRGSSVAVNQTCRGWGRRGGVSPWPPSRGSGGAGIAAARPIADQAPQCLRLQVQTLSCSAPCEPISDDPSVCSASADCKNALRHRASAAASDSPWQRPLQRLYRSERPDPPHVRRKKSLHPPAGPPTATSPASRAAGNVCQAVQGWRMSKRRICAIPPQLRAVLRVAV